MIISRLTLSAVVFASVAAAGIAFAAEARAPQVTAGNGKAVLESTEVVVMPMVQVIGRRSR